MKDMQVSTTMGSLPQQEEATLSAFAEASGCQPASPEASPMSLLTLSTMALAFERSLRNY